jgi:hypothetical protein
MNNKIIFWDMDETLGFFRHFPDYDDISAVPEQSKKSGLKGGIDGLLSELSSDGFTHYVTTSGMRSYTDIALNATGIMKHFSKVYAMEDICPYLGLGYYGDKNYMIPLKDLDINVEKAGSDVLIIGNSTDDVPYNIRDIVSIIDENNWLRESELTEKMIYLLIDKGDGDFNKGFHKLYDESEKIAQLYTHLSDIGRITLEDDVVLKLKLMEERHKFIQAPMFIVEKAQKYFSLV